jgi:hypothetical protein
MQLDPDNETEYRRGGKIMKKIPRKFSAGGVPSTTAPTTKPPEKTRPDRVPPAEAAKMKAELEQKRLDDAQQKKGAERPNLGKIGFKKGGKVRKYEGGGAVDPAQAEQDAREIKTAQDQMAARDADMALNPNTTPKGRFSDDTYSRAYNYVNKLRLPPGAAAEKDYEVSGGTKSAPKAAPRKFSAPKPAPKKETSGGSGGSGATEPDVPPQYKRDAPTLGNRGEKHSFNAENALMLASAIPAVRGVRAAKGALDTLRTSRAAKKAGDAVAEANKVGKAAKEAAAARKRAPRDLDEERMAGEGGSRFKRGGVAKYAKGGGVEAKGKTKGKIVKMAKGGSVRGYGISKVTNKTKYV